MPSTPSQVRASSVHGLVAPLARPVTPPVLSERALNRALLHRQLLLERSGLALSDAIEQVAGLQTQYAPSGYIGLWSRLRDVRREDLTAALEDRSVIQASLMRVTIHMVARRDFWPFALGVREARRMWALKSSGEPGEAAMVERAASVQAALAAGPRTVKELGDLGAGFVGNLGLWVDLVRVPPSGTWEHRRADRLALAETWVGAPDSTEDAGMTRLVQAYLRAFGPASWRHIAAWAGISVGDARRGGEGLTLVAFRDQDGRPLVDIPDAPLPDPGMPVPVRFLPHWDANLLVHARRTGLLPEVHRPRVFSSRNPFSVGTVLVDGRVVATWSQRDSRIVVELLEDVSSAERRSIEDEREALESFCA